MDCHCKLVGPLEMQLTKHSPLRRQAPPELLSMLSMFGCCAILIPGLSWLVPTDQLYCKDIDYTWNTSILWVLLFFVPSLPLPCTMFSSPGFVDTAPYPCPNCSSFPNWMIYPVDFNTAKDRGTIFSCSLNRTSHAWSSPHQGSIAHNSEKPSRKSMETIESALCTPGFAAPTDFRGPSWAALTSGTLHFSLLERCAGFP